MREEERTQENAISKEKKTKVSQKWTVRQRGNGGEWKKNLARTAEFLS